MRCKASLCSLSSLFHIVARYAPLSLSLSGCSPHSYSCTLILIYFELRLADGCVGVDFRPSRPLRVPLATVRIWRCTATAVPTVKSSNSLHLYRKSLIFSHTTHSIDRLHKRVMVASWAWSVACRQDAVTTHKDRVTDAQNTHTTFSCIGKSLKRNDPPSASCSFPLARRAALLSDFRWFKALSG